MNYKLEQLPPGDQILIGRGKLTWMKSERVSDRYGAVWLMGVDETSLSGKATAQPLWFPPLNQAGRLIARVIDARDSTHIGDFFRGIAPTTPLTGDVFLLGTGTASKETVIGIDTFLLCPPAKEQSSNWLNPYALYNCHESVVELIWLPLTALQLEEIQSQLP